MRRATEVDTVAGKRLRALRIERGMSQSEVGHHLGVTFQQVQKYENGSNRMGASRLAALASLLEVSVTDFFEKKGRSQHEGGHHFIETSQERRLLVAFRRLSPAQRAAIADLVESYD